MYVHTASDGVSISLASNTMSENTNNITTASVNELFSNSSLLRMNAVIPESASVCTAAAAVSVVGEKGVNVVGDSASRVCVEVSSVYTCMHILAGFYIPRNILKGMKIGNLAA